MDLFDKVNEVNNELFIMGSNKYGLCLANWFKNHSITVKGFIDDFLYTNDFNGFKIFKSDCDFKNSFIINCVVEGRVIDVEKHIESLKPLYHDNYFRIQKEYYNELLEITFLGHEELLLDDEIKQISNLLVDDQSKNEFQSVISFRKTRDINYMKSFKMRLQEQYFEDFIQLDLNPIFVDGGGFDGKTTLMFTQLYPKYKKIFYFEPNIEMLEKSQQILKDYDNISFINKGIWKKNDILGFDNKLGSASKLDTEESTNIEVISLDNFIQEKIDFIKFDIEGAEYNALEGARNLIKEYKPKMAICIYHNSQDYIRIPKLIMSYNPDYKLYFRHYTQGVYESVMYFV